MTPKENAERRRLRSKIQRGKATRKDVLRGIDLETQLRREAEAKADQEAARALFEEIGRVR